MAASDFEAYMQRLIAALREPLSDAALAVERAQPYSAPVFLAPSRADMRAVDRACREAVEALETIEDAFNACRLGYVVGVLIEEGADANHLARGLARCLAQRLQELRPLLAAVDPEGDGVDQPLEHVSDFPAGVRAALGLRDLGLAAMTALCRAKRARIEVRRWEELRRDLRELPFPNRWYLDQLLDSVDELELCVLHPEQGRGFRVVTQAIRNNFHLFSMLQASLVGDVRRGLLEGPPTDPALRAYMRGETSARPAASDHALWHFGSYRSWTSSGFDSDLASTSIWGEGSPRDIPTLEGQRYVLLGPCPLKSKSWDTNFIAGLHPAHEARLFVSMLTRGEVTELLERLASHDVREA